MILSRTLAAVKFLVEKYSHNILCEKDENGHTAAHWACLGGYLNIIQYMVDIGVSINVPSSSSIGAYPIHWACVEGHVSIVDFLVRVSFSYVNFLFLEMHLNDFLWRLEGNTKKLQNMKICVKSI